MKRFSLLLAIALFVPAFAFAQVAVDYGRACYCPSGDLAAHSDPHMDANYEWLGASKDYESSCPDDADDNDGVAAVYMTYPNCGRMHMIDCMMGRELMSIEVDVCVWNKADTRFDSNSLFLSGWVDYASDGTFDASDRMVFEHVTRILPNGDDDPGSCTTVNTSCFEMTPSEIDNNWTWGEGPDPGTVPPNPGYNCQRYRLTFHAAENVVIDHDVNPFALRLRLAYNNCIDNPCNPYTGGEVEDYFGDEFPFGDCSAVETFVDLAAFDAVAADTDVEISWETLAEPFAQGYNVLRATSEDGKYVPVNGALIPAEGDELTGGSYAIADRGLENGTYYYKLEVLTSGGSNAYYGPEEVTVAAAPFGCGIADAGNAALVVLLLIVGGLLVASRRSRT